MCAVLYTFSIIICYLPHFILHMLIFYISLGVMQNAGTGGGGGLAEIHHCRQFGRGGRFYYRPILIHNNSNLT